MSKKISVKFWCNAGHTEETVTIEIDESKDEDAQIIIEFHKWLDNNEDCGYEKID